MRSAKWLLLVLGAGVLWAILPESEVAPPVHAIPPPQTAAPCNPPDGGNCCCWGFTPAGYSCGAWMPPVENRQECRAYFTGGEVPGCGQTDQQGCTFVDQ